MGQYKYCDFQLEIKEDEIEGISVSARSETSGEAEARIPVPFDEQERLKYLHAVEKALLRSGRQQRRVLTPEEDAVQRFGSRLFDSIVTGQIRTLYQETWATAHSQRKGVRIKLCVPSPRLATLPWEFLFDAREGDYICLSAQTPIVRYVSLPQPIEPMQIELPLRILGMTSDPKDLARLDIAREKQHMEQAISALRGKADLTWIDGASWRELQRSMRQGPWHVFHFIGHGDFDPLRDEGVIYLEDDSGYSASLTATKLARLLNDHAELRLVVLNSCEGAHGGENDIFSSPAAALVRRGIPAVVGMQYEITDSAAKEFSRSFYEYLVLTYAVDTAVSEARKAISLAAEYSFEWATPVLYLRSNDGVLFRPSDDVKTSEPAKSKPPVEPPPPKTHIQPQAVHCATTLTQEQAQKGCKQTIHFVRKAGCDTCSAKLGIRDPECRRCGGDGLIEEKRRVTVTIPAGVKDGQEFRLRGHGSVSTPNGIADDVMVEVHIEPKIVDEIPSIVVTARQPTGEFSAGISPVNMVLVEPENDRAFWIQRQLRTGEVLPRRKDPYPVPVDDESASFDQWIEKHGVPPNRDRARQLLAAFGLRLPTASQIENAIANQLHTSLPAPIFLREERHRLYLPERKVGYAELSRDPLRNQNQRSIVGVKDVD